MSHFTTVINNPKSLWLTTNILFLPNLGVLQQTFMFYSWVCGSTVVGFTSAGLSQAVLDVPPSPADSPSCVLSTQGEGAIASLGHALLLADGSSVGEVGRNMQSLLKPLPRASTLFLLPTLLLPKSHGQAQCEYNTVDFYSHPKGEKGKSKDLLNILTQSTIPGKRV